MNNRKLKSIKPAFIITSVYILIGASWIYLSDRIPLLLNASREEEIIMQTLKGWFYILATGILLFFLIKQQIKKRNRLITLLTSDNLLLNKILNISSDFSIFVVDQQGNIILTKGEVINLVKTTKNGRDKIEDLFSETITTFFSSLWQIKQASLQEYQILEKWYEVSGSILKDETEETELAILIFKDITAQKRTDNELLKSITLINTLHTETDNWKTAHKILNNQYQIIKENLYNGIILASVNSSGQPSQIIEINRASRGIFNLPDQEISLEELTNIIKNQNHGKERLLFENNYQLNRQIVTNLLIKRLNQPSREIEITGRYVSSEKEWYVLFILKDKTSYSTHSFGQLNVDHKKMLNSLNIGLMLFHAGGKCFFMNKTMEQLLGVEISDEDVLLPEDLETLGQDIHLNDHLEKCFTGQIVRVSLHKLKKQTNQWFESIFIPVESDQQTPFYVVRIVRDVTQFVELSQEIKILKEELDKRSMLKDVFLGNLSHEIRTPMNSILGFLELLSLESLTQTQNEYARYIQQNSEALFKIINSLIELSQLENKSVSVHKDWLNLQELTDQFRNIGLQMQANYNNPKIQFNLYISETLNNKQVYSDMLKILTIAGNILDNAFKFTQEGRIDVTLEITPKNYLKIRIKDTGCGIQSNNIKNIYIPFATFKNQNNAVFGGLGLGLPIAKRYSDLLGGSIEVQSTEGVGSEFIIKIPLAISSKTEPEKNEELIPRKILLVQYSFEGVPEIQSQFSQYETEVIYCSSGTEALEAILEQPDIDLVITDIYFTDMKSLEFLSALRRMRSDIPVIAQTVLFIKEEYDQYIQAGFVDYLLKPIKASHIFRLAIRGKESINDSRL